MRMYARDFRAHARLRLKEFWGMAIGVSCVAVVILFAASFTVVGSLLLAGALELGLCVFFTRTMLGERPPFSALFDRFEIFFKSIGLALFISLFVCLWSFLLWVPGVIAAYRYAMAPYLMAEYPHMGIREAVDRSKQLMDGNKGRLFCLHLSFIGWGFLSALTFGILMIWLLPYMQAAESSFYLHITGRLNAPGQDAAAPQPDQPGANQ